MPVLVGLMAHDIQQSRLCGAAMKANGQRGFVRIISPVKGEVEDGKVVAESVELVSCEGRL